MVTLLGRMIWQLNASRGPIVRRRVCISLALLSMLAPIAVFGIGGGSPKSGDAKPLCGDDAPKIDNTNAGTSFLLCFEQNYLADPGAIPDGYLEIYLATLNDPATVTITSNRYPKLKKIFTIAAQSSQVYRITDDAVDFGGGITDTLSDLWITSDEAVDQRVVRVDATAPIVCYGMNKRQYTADAFLAFPQKTAGTDYRVMSYQNSTNVSPNMPSQFAVAAWDSATQVTITPSCATAGNHPANLPFTVTLNAGECVQVQTDPTITGLDLTGSIVTANHKVVVYGGNARTEIPNNYSTADGSTSRDILLEAMPPTADWGETFVLSAIDITSTQKDPLGDLIRVLALNANTTVKVNGVPSGTLAANGFIDFMVTGPTVVETSGPALVGEYFHTNTSAGANGPSDPSLAIVPPIEEAFNDFTFFASSDVTSFSSIQKVIIAADALAQNSIILDGTLLPGGFFTPLPVSVGGHSYSILEFGPLSPGPHHITSNAIDTTAFTILCYGTGPVISYGYTAGSLMKPQRTVFIKDNDPREMSMGHHTNHIQFYNTCPDPAYLDSAVFTPTRVEDNQFGIHSKENIAMEIGRMPVGGDASLHLISDLPLTNPVVGTLSIYSHTPNWSELDPTVHTVTLLPDASGSVATSTGARQASPTMLSASSYPNPFSLYTNIQFSLPEAGDVTLTLYDELGRTVRTIATGNFAAGPYTVRLERRALQPGFYTCEIASERLNIKERVAIVAEE